MQKLDEIIREEEARLLKDISPSNGLNILYNLILLKNKFEKKMTTIKTLKNLLNSILK